MKEEKEIEIHSHTHTHTKPTQIVSDAFGPIMAITLSIHVRHKIYACIPSGHYCCLCWCGELSLQWVVGLRACCAADSVRLCVNVCVRVCVCARERQGWVTQQRENTKERCLRGTENLKLPPGVFPWFFNLQARKLFTERVEKSLSDWFLCHSTCDNPVWWVFKWSTWSLRGSFAWP